MDYRALFNKYGIQINNIQIKMFEEYYALLVQENEKYNLTTIVSEYDVWLKHFLDSVLPIKCFKNDATLLDIGGGAGFPSIPLKIVRPDLKITIIDSVGKKVDFMNMVISKLALTDIVDIHTRCEDIAKSPMYRENFDYVVARAVAPLSTLLEYTVPFIRLNGKLVLYKGANYKEEINNTINTIKLLDCKLDDVLEIKVEEGGYDRMFLIYSKNSITNKKYPRGQNKPRLNPLN